MSVLTQENLDNLLDRTIEQVERNLTKEYLNAFLEKDTIELMLNEDGSLWIEKLGKGISQIGAMKPFRSRALLSTVASFNGLTVNADFPEVSGVFPIEGARFMGHIEPTVTSPVFSIRKKAINVFTLSDYVDNKIITEQQKNVIEDFIKNRKNILVAGGTGSGKTTLTNAVIESMVSHDNQDRFVVIEDTREIQCTAPNSVSLLTSKNVSMTDLLRSTLRMRPDRILIGEVRGKEALDLCDAWNTGHPGGVATLHANGAIETLDRLRGLIFRNENAPKAQGEVEKIISRSVDLILFIKKHDGSRVLEQMLELENYDPISQRYSYKFI